MFVDAQLEFSDAQGDHCLPQPARILSIFNPAFDYNTVIDAGAGEPTFLVVIPGVTFTADDDATLAIELRSYASEDLSDTPNVIFYGDQRAFGSGSWQTGGCCGSAIRRISALPEPVLHRHKRPVHGWCSGCLYHQRCPDVACLCQ